MAVQPETAHAPLTISERQDMHERNQVALMRAHNDLADAVMELAKQVNTMLELAKSTLEASKPESNGREPFKRHKGH